MNWIRRRLSVVVPTVWLLLALAWHREDPGGLLSDFRQSLFDYYQRFEPRQYEPVPVRIIDIDDETLARTGLQWPWPRNIIADLVTRLTQAGAATIVFDFVFAEPDRTSPRQAVKYWSDKDQASGLGGILGSLPDHDVLFAKAIKDAGNVVLGYSLNTAPGGRMPRATAGIAYQGGDPREFLLQYQGYIPNLPVLEAVGAGSGAFNFAPSRSLTVRAVPLVLQTADGLLPTISAEALRVAQGAGAIVLKINTGDGFERRGIQSVRIGRITVPTDTNGQFRLHFTDYVAERYLPAWRLFSGEFAPELVRGNIVFVGTSAAGLKDLRPSPLNPAMPGVEAHAQAVEQILQGDFLVRPDWAEALEWLFALVVGAAIIFTLRRRRRGALWAAVAGGGAIVLAFAFAWYSYKTELQLFDPAAPSLVAIVVYLSGSLLDYLRVENERQQARRAFAYYLAPDLVEQVAANPSRLRLGGEKKRMTFLFCDVRGFTTVSERYKDDPEGLTQLINKFLTPMTEVILSHKGTIDKYMGDAIMAFWNAPLDDPDHAKNACLAALEMQDALKALNIRLAEEHNKSNGDFTPLNIGIGLNTGDCVVGNMGSQLRFNYSVLGDAVNLASRLEGQTKTYGVPIIIGEETYQSAPEFGVIELDLIAVKGKQEATRIFTLVNPAQPLTSKFRDTYARMLDAYRAQDWDLAQKYLEEALLEAGEYGRLIALYQDRIRAFKHNPPDRFWNGVFVAMDK